MTDISEKTLDAATANAARLFVSSVAGRYPVRAAMLFGSRARGGFRSNSDADIAVLLEGPHNHFWQPSWSWLISPTTCSWKPAYTFSLCPYGRKNGNILKRSPILA